MNRPIRSRESSLGKCLLYNCEALSSDPQHPHEAGVPVCVQCWMESRGLLRLESLLAWINKLQVQQENLPQKFKGGGEGGIKVDD